jgi:hypothetical protein
MNRGNNPLIARALSLPRALTSTRGEGRTNRSSEAVAAAELGPDKIAVFAKSLAQLGDLNPQVLLRDNDARPHSAHELFFGDQRSVGVQQDQEEIEGACPQLYWHAVGHQLPPAQQEAETAEFEHRVDRRAIGWRLAAAGFRGRGRAWRSLSSSWGLCLVCRLQFGAAVCAGRVNDCGIVQPFAAFCEHQDFGRTPE